MNSISLISWTTGVSPGSPLLNCFQLTAFLNIKSPLSAVDVWVPHPEKGDLIVMTKASPVSSFKQLSPSPWNFKLSISSLKPCSVIIFLSRVTLMYESPQTIFGCVTSQNMPEYPVLEQSHVNFPLKSSQRPPFLHGSSAQVCFDAVIVKPPGPAPWANVSVGNSETKSFIFDLGKKLRTESWVEFG